MIRALSLVLALLLAPPVLAERAVTVFAAASLGGVLEDIAEGFAGDVTFSYGGSGTMARQVAAGAPADVVILANTLWMGWLADQGITAAATPTVIAQGTLVLITPKNKADAFGDTTIPDYLGTRRLAMGHRSAVPAGVYTRQWLAHHGLWDQLSHQLAETDNVRAALALVARGQVPLGVVYASDAMAEPAVAPVWIIDHNTHDAIEYPAAALTPEGAAFLAHLTTPAADALFRARGFRKVAPLGN